MDKNELRQKVDYYMSLPYTISVERRDEQGGYYIARYIELSHFIMTGDTPEEAVHELESEKREWFELNIEEGNKIPLPLQSRNYSGKVIIRMSPTLHNAIAVKSEKEEVSLNQFMVTALARSVGYDEPKKRKTAEGTMAVRETKRKYQQK